MMTSSKKSKLPCLQLWHFFKSLLWFHIQAKLHSKGLTGLGFITGNNSPSCYLMSKHSSLERTDLNLISFVCHVHKSLFNIAISKLLFIDQIKLLCAHVKRAFLSVLSVLLIKYYTKPLS